MPLSNSNPAIPPGTIPLEQNEGPLRIASPAERVLIYRLGSLGDTVVALPCFHLIARTFPHAERALLTNTPIDSKAPAAAAVLGSSGLVHRYFEYPVRTRNPWRLGRLALNIRRYRPHVLIYLAAPRGQAAIQRDLRFFRFCGIRRVYGVLPGNEAAYQQDPVTSLWESEAHRLARTLGPLGGTHLYGPESWDLRLSDSEKAAASASTVRLGHLPYLVCAPGCKAQANDWEDHNWTALLASLSARLNRDDTPHALALTGSLGDHERVERLRAAWQGPSINLCGNTPREAAALLASARLYLGPDSGPMHLAAAVGTPCVSIFSARLPLGIWFPHGSQHQVLYHRTSCSPCSLETCIPEQKRCILSITPQQVLEAALRILQPAFPLPGPIQECETTTFD